MVVSNYASLINKKAGKEDVSSQNDAHRTRVQYLSNRHGITFTIC